MIPGAFLLEAQLNRKNNQQSRNGRKPEKERFRYPVILLVTWHLEEQLTTEKLKKLCYKHARKKKTEE